MGSFVYRSSHARRRALGVALVIGGFASAARADEAPSIFVLEWIAPEGCPVREDVERRIAHLLGSGTRARQAVHARSVVSRRPSGGFRADVEISTSTDRSARQVDGDTCETVSDALSIMVALAIDPEAGLTPSPPPPAAAPKLSPPRSPVVDSPRPVALHPVFVGASARLELGTLPAPAFGGEVVLGIATEHLDLEAFAALVARASAQASTRPGEGASIGIADVGARGCYELRSGPFDLGPCAGMSARWMSASGFGSRAPSDATGHLAVVSFGALAKVHLGVHLALRALAEAELGTSRPSFLIDTETVYRAPIAGFRTTIGIEVHF